MNALSTITVMPSTKAEIEVFVSKVKTEILSGDYNPVVIDVQLKAMEELIKAIRKEPEIREYILDEISRNEKTFELGNAKITQKDSVRYDYSDDTEWGELKEQETNFANARKGREQYLRSLKKATPDPNTGEILYPPRQERTSTYSITLK